MSIRVKALLIFLLVSMFPLSVISLIAFFDFGTIQFYTQIAVIAIVVTLVSLLVAQQLSDSILRISSAAKKVSEGDFDVQLEAHSRDELGRLADHFNSMVIRLKEQRDEVELSRQEAERASELKSEFITNISHETKTPMNGILGMSELLSDTDLTQDQRECLTMLRDSANGMMVLLNDMLDFSRLEANLLEVDEVHFELRDAVEQSLIPCQQAVRGQPVDLSVVIAEDVPNGVIGDPSRLRQVLFNLVGNAVKFTERGAIEVLVGVESMTQEDVLLRFRIRDTGCGVPKNKHEHIFNAFMQGDATATRAYGGVGLGLTIASQIVETMSGSIWLTSPVHWQDNQQSPGSEFQFTIHMGVQKGVRNLIDHDGDIEQASVLLVNQHLANRTVFQDLMTGWGMQVVLCDSGEQALHLLGQENDIHLVLFESALPDMTGFQFASNIQSLESTYRGRSVMLTANGQRGDAKRCKQLGVSAYLTKPVHAYELRQVVQELVAEPATLDVPCERLITRHTLRESRKRFNVLVLEPLIADARGLESTLLSWGHEVDLAETEREAKMKFAEKVYDIFLLGPHYPQKAMDFLNGAQEDSSRRDGERGPVVLGFSDIPSSLRKDIFYRKLEQPFKSEELFEVANEVFMALESCEELPIQGEAHEAALAGLVEAPVAVFDVDKTMRALGGDRELLTEVAEMFVCDIEPLIKSLRSAVGAEDWAKIERATHSIKGAVGNFHCHAANQIILTIEATITDGNKQTLPGQVAALGVVLQELVAELKVLAEK